MKKILFLFLVAAPIWGMDVINVGLRVSLEYSDLDHHCRLSSLIQPWRLAAEMEDGKVVRARLKKTPIFSAPSTYDLTQGELEGLRIIEEKGYVWVKTFSVSPEMLRALILTGEGSSRDACVPPHGIATVEPDSILFDFGIESVGYLLPTLINSQEVIIRGQTEISERYRVKLSLTQVRS